MSYTPAEFHALVLGWEWRTNDEYERQAMWVTAILNGAGQLKHPITVEQLIGRPLSRALRRSKDGNQRR